MIVESRDDNASNVTLHDLRAATVKNCERVNTYARIYAPADLKYPGHNAMSSRDLGFDARQAS
jgi:hypothetical protein